MKLEPTKEQSHGPTMVFVAENKKKIAILQEKLIVNQRLQEPVIAHLAYSCPDNIDI